MLKRIIAIVAIFVCTAVAWAILGSTIFYRTYNAESGLAGRVASTWGAPQGQAPPAIAYEWPEERTVEVEEKGKKITRTAQQAVYDNVQLLLDDKPLALTFSGSQAVARTRMAAGAKSMLKAAYRSQGLDNWKYTFARENADGNGKEISQARDFHLLVKTDFSGFDFPDNSLSPTEKRQTANGWELEWNYQNLVSGFDIALKMPQKLQPGPLAGRISYFGPVSLFFFFFLVFILSTLRGNDHPMNYFFLACA